MTDITPRKLVFIDARVPGLQDLLDGLAPDERAFVLNSSNDGVQQIADVLASNNFSDISSISIVSHGNTGTLDLGSSVITEANLSAHSNALAEIGASLAPGGIIKLYGCDVAQGAAGQQFINDFSTFAGGAEVDAATHVVGASALGGSWTLNAASNGMSAPSNGSAPFTSIALANFNGTLDGASDPQIWTTIIGPNGLVHADDNGSTAVNTTTLYSGNTTFTNPTDVVLDPTDGVYFILDHTGGENIILEGSLTQALNNPSAAPTFSTVFVDTDTSDFIPEIALDTVNHQLYFVDINNFTGGTSEISQFERLNYNATGLTTLATATTLGTVGSATNGGVVGFALDLSNQEAVFAFNAGGFVGAGTPSSPNIPASAFLYSATGVTSSASSVTISSLPVGTAGNFTFDASLGNFTQDGGLAIDTATHQLYFTLTGGSAATEGGLYEYDLTGNANGSFSVIWQQTDSSSPSVALNALAIDPTTGTWYASTDAIGSIDIWKGSLTGGAPTAFLTFANDGSTGLPQELWLDQQPTLALTAATPTFTEDGASVSLVSAATATDPDNGDLVSATVSISSGFRSSDTLPFSTAGTSITGSYNSSTGVLTLSGIDTPADYETVLQSVQYHGGENPTDFSRTDTSRTLTWTVNDGLLTSAPQTSSVSVLFVNDPPILSGLTTASWTEEGATATLSSGASVTDPDDLNLTSATVAITGGTFAGDGDVLAANVAGTSITANYNAATETLTLSGTDTLAHYQSVLDSVTFHAGENPTNFGADPTRTVTWTLTDPSGTANGGLASSTTTSTINVTRVNDAPTLSNVAASAQYTEEGPATTLSSAVTVTNPDDLNLSSATVAITGGTFAGDGDVLGANVAGTAITASYNAATETLTLTGSDTLAHYQSVLDSVTFNAGENPNDFGANPTRTVSWTLNDGSGSFNLSTPQTTTVNITNVNDAPTLSNVAASAQYTEEGGAVTLSNAITVTDPDNLNLANATVQIAGGTFAGDSDVLAATAVGNITVNYNSATETLTLSGSDTLANYQTILDSVTFSAGENPNDFGSNPTRTVTWVVNDGSGSFNLSNVATTTIGITNVNDRPTLSNVAASASFTQGGGAVTLSGAASASDPDNLTLVGATVAITGGTFAGDGDVLLANVSGTSITASYSAGTETLTLSGSDTLAHYTQVLDSVAFNSTSGNPTDFGSFPTRTVTWVVNDGSGSFNLSAPQTETINITNVNDAPTLAGVAASASYTEQSAPTTLSGNVTVSDPDDTTLVGATVSLTGGTFAGDNDVLATSTAGTSITASYDSANERLVLSGTDTLADYQSVLDKVTFSEAGDNPTNYGSNPTRTVTWVLNDGHASNNLSTAQTETLNVIAVNDQPTLANVAATVGFLPHHTITISPSIAVSDPDNLTLANATVRITAGTFAGDGDVLAANVSGTSITASYNAATETLTLSGVDTVAHYQSVLDSVTFSSGGNPSNGNSNRTRTVTWVVNDGSGSNNLSTAATTTISIGGGLPRNDFNGDGNSDLLFQNSSNQHPDVMVEVLNGSSVASSGTITAPNGLIVEAMGDFNHDSKADIVLQASDGTPQIWLMNGTSRTSTVTLSNPGSSWHVIASDDFNSDGNADILWQNTNGTPMLWLMNGTSVVTSATLTNPGSSWSVIGAGDFNGDGNADILFQKDDKTPMIWEMNGSSVIASATLPNPGQFFNAIGTGDFNGDGNADILYQNKDGTPLVWEMNGTSILTTATLTNPGVKWHAIGTEDFNGDGKADILFQNGDGTPLVWQMNGTSVASTFTTANPGSQWVLQDDGPIPANQMGSGGNSGGGTMHQSAPDGVAGAGLLAPGSSPLPGSSQVNNQHLVFGT